MRAPKKTLYKKRQKGKGVWKGGHVLEERRYGESGLKVRESGRVSARQREAGRRILRRSLLKQGKVRRRKFPDTSATSKGLNQRMGKGKGGVDYWFANLHSGEILYEVEGVKSSVAKAALLKLASKLPLKAMVVERKEGVRGESRSRKKS